MHWNRYQHIRLQRVFVISFERHKHGPRQCQSNLIPVVVFETLDRLGHSVPVEKRGHRALEMERFPSAFTAPCRLGFLRRTSACGASNGSNRLERTPATRANRIISLSK